MLIFYFIHCKLKQIQLKEIFIIKLKLFNVFKKISNFYLFKFPIDL